MSQEMSNQRWSFPLEDVTLDRSGNRSATAGNMAHELVGVDGATRGGLRPFPGFITARELDFYDDERHDSSSQVIDFYPVDFKIGAQQYGYGFVYRVRRSVLEEKDELADVFVDFWNSATNEWVGGELVMDGVSPSANFSVVVRGKLVYIFVAGRSPARFYVREVC